MALIAIVRDEDEIEKVRDGLMDHLDKSGGRSKWPGMSYEQGVQATLDWLTGDRDDPPMEDE